MRIDEMTIGVTLDFDLQAKYDNVMTLLLQSRLGHGNCKKENCCTACMAAKELDKLVSEYKGGVVSLQ